MDKRRLWCDMGARLRERRLELGYTQEQVAELLEIDPNYYGRIERGGNCLSVVKIILAHERLGIDPLYLLTGEVRKGLAFCDVLSECPVVKQKQFERLIEVALELVKG